MSLKKCKCGLEAKIKEELEWFSSATNCSYGKSNTCKRCDNLNRIAKRKNCTIEEAEKFIQKEHTATYLRKCRECSLEAHTEQDLKEFVRKTGSIYNTENLCRKCQSIKNKAIRYGVSTEFIKNSTSCYCQICGNTENLVYDHCHMEKSGEKAFRGVLCQGCNLGLGGFKDNISFLQNAIKYLATFYLDDKNHTISSLK